MCIAVAVISRPGLKSISVTVAFILKSTLQFSKYFFKGNITDSY